MFDWIIRKGTTVLDTKKELLEELNKTLNMNLSLDRYDFYFLVHLLIITIY